MSISWSQQTDIVTALAAKYPETDRLSLSSEDLRQMVAGLEGFADSPQPPDAAVLNHILWGWMRFAGEDSE
jgi:FeS assembly protein IscX